MKKYSRRAIVSLILGLIGVFVGISHAGWFPVAALPLGVAALASGCAGLWSIRRDRAALRGTALAALGSCLGTVATAIGILMMLGLFMQQLYRDQHQQQVREQVMEVQRAVARNPMPADPLAEFTSNLPIGIIETAGQPFSKEEQITVRARFFDTRNGRASLAAKPEYDGLGTIHLRGTTTLHWPKHSFTFHTVDAKTNQIKVPLLGLPKEADWVLYSPYEDKTLIRDVLAYELAGKMGDWAPRTRYFEMFIKSSSGPLTMRDYVGVYVLIEKIKRGKDRVNVAKLEPSQVTEPEISGGYIVKRDHHERNGLSFHTQRGGPYFYVYPNPKDITREQRAWLARYFRSFEAALYGDDFTDPQKGYAAYLDVDSFIDAHWLIESSKNIDGFRYSTFLTKDRNGKLKPQPPWDYNRAFGNANYYDGWEVQGWYWPNLRPHEISCTQRLREDPEFVKRCRKRWVALRKDVFNPQRIKARIDELAAQLEEAQSRNFKRWPLLGRQVASNYFVGRSYPDEVRWLKNWVDGRINWIDHQVRAGNDE